MITVITISLLSGFLAGLLGAKIMISLNTMEPQEQEELPDLYEKKHRPLTKNEKYLISLKNQMKK